MLNYLQNSRGLARVPSTVALHSRLASLLLTLICYTSTLVCPSYCHLMKTPTHTKCKVSLLSGVLGACYMAYPLGGLLDGEEICTSLLAHTHIRSTGVHVNE